MTEIAIVYMVAGLSKRFEGKPKFFVKVGPNDETLIEYSMNQALPAGFSKIIFIVGEKTEQPFKEAFGNSYKGTPIFYAKQTFDPKKRERPWGTTDALCSAKEFLDCPFVVASGDDIYGEKAFKILANHLKTSTGDATVGYKLKNVLSEDGSVNRGVFEVDSEGYVESIKEVFEITPNNFSEKNLSEDSLCSLLLFGMYKETFDMLYKILVNFKEDHKENPRIECLLPGELGYLIKKGKIKMKAYSTEEKWLGLTNPEDEEKVREQLKKI